MRKNYSAILALIACLVSNVAMAQVFANPTGTALGNNVNSGNVMGRIDGNSNGAGVVGEEIDSTVLIGAAVSLTSTTPANITSVALTPGNWLCYGSAFINPAGTTTTSTYDAAINTVSATLPTAPNDGAYVNSTLPLGAGQIQAVEVGPRLYKLAAATTAYLVLKTTFAVSTETAYGYLGCFRQP